MQIPGLGVLRGLLGAKLAEFGGLDAEAGFLAQVIQAFISEDEHSECEHLPASVCIRLCMCAHICLCMSVCAMYSLREVSTSLTSKHSPAAEHVVQRGCAISILEGFQDQIG